MRLELTSRGLGVAAVTAMIVVAALTCLNFRAEIKRLLSVRAASEEELQLGEFLLGSVPDYGFVLREKPDTMVGNWGYFYGKTRLLFYEARISLKGDDEGFTVWLPNGNILYQRVIDMSVARGEDYVLDRFDPPWEWGMQAHDDSTKDLSGLQTSELWSDVLIAFHSLDLRDGDLSNSILENVSFEGTDLSGANLAGARFLSCDLSGAIGLTTDQVLTTLQFVDTAFPEDIANALAELGVDPKESVAPHR